MPPPPVAAAPPAPQGLCIDVAPDRLANRKFQKFARDFHRVLAEIERIPVADSSYGALHDQMRKMHHVLESSAKERFHEIPDKILVMQAFHKCLVDCQSMGVHRQAIATLGKLLEFLGPHAARTFPLFITSVFVSMPQAAFATVPEMRLLLWQNVMSLPLSALQPSADALLSALLPHIEDTADGAGKEAQRILDGFVTKLEEAQRASVPSEQVNINGTEDIVGPHCFYRSLWNIVRNVPALRPQALLFALHRLPRSPAFVPGDSRPAIADDAAELDLESPDPLQPEPHTGRRGSVGSPLNSSIAADVVAKLGGDPMFAHTALCVAVRDRSEQTVNRALEVLHACFAMHDPTIFDDDEKVSMLVAALPLVAVNRYSTLSRFFRWIYGGTDLVVAIAYYRSVSHRYVQDALQRMIPDVAVAAKRSELIAAGDVLVLEKTSTSAPIRQSEAHGIDVFIALQQRSESDSTFHLLVPDVIRQVSDLSLRNPVVAASCSAICEAVPSRMFLQYLDDIVQSFCENEATSGNLYVRDGALRVLQHVMILAEVVSKHLAAVHGGDLDTAPKPTAQDWAVAEALVEHLCGMLIAVCDSEDLSGEDFRAVALRGATVLDMLTTSVMLPLRRFINEIAPTLRRGDPAFHHATLTESGDDLVMRSEEATSLAAQELSLGAVEKAVAAFLKITVERLNTATCGAAPVPDAAGLLRDVGGLAFKLFSSGDGPGLCSGDSPWVATVEAIVDVAVRSTAGDLVVEAIRFVSEARGLDARHDPPTAMDFDDRPPSPAEEALNGSIATRGPTEEGLGATPEVSPTERSLQWAAVCVERVWSLFDIEYAPLHGEAKALLLALCAQQPKLRTTAARLMHRTTETNCRRFVALFRTVVDSDHGREPALLTFIEGLLMILRAPPLRPLAVGSWDYQPPSATPLLRQTFVTESIPHTHSVIGVLIDALLLRTVSIAPEALEKEMVDSPTPSPGAAAARDIFAPASDKLARTSASSGSAVASHDGTLRPLFVSLVQGLVASQPDAIVAHLRQQPPHTGALHDMAFAAPDVADSVQPTTLFASLVVLTVRIIRQVVGERKPLPDTVDPQCKNWMADGVPSTAQARQESHPLAFGAIVLLRDLMCTAVSQPMASTERERDTLGSLCTFIALHTGDLLLCFTRSGIVAPQLPLLQLLKACLGYLEARVSGGLGAAQAFAAGVASSDSVRASQATAQLRARNTTAAKQLEGLVSMLVPTTCSGLFFAAAADLSPALAGFGLLAHWSLFMRQLLPWSHVVLPAAVEQFVSSLMTTVCLITKHELSAASGAVLRIGLDQLRFIIEFLFAESTRAAEGSSIEKAAPDSSGVAGLFFGSKAAAPTARTPYQDAHQKLHDALPSLIETLTETLLKLRGQATIPGLHSPPSVTPPPAAVGAFVPSPAPAPHQPSPSAGSAPVRRHVEEGLSLLLQLVLLHTETEAEVLYRMMCTMGRQKTRSAQLIAWARTPQSLPPDDIALAKAVASAPHLDLPGVLKATTRVLDFHRGRRSGHATTDVEAAVAYALNCYVSVNGMSGSQADVLERLREATTALLSSNASPVAITLCLTLVNSAVTLLNPATINFQDPRVSWVSTTLQKAFSMTVERSSLDAAVTSAVSGHVDTLAATVWGKDLDPPLRLALTIVRDRLPAVMDSAQRNEAPHLTLLMSMLGLLKGSPRLQDVHAPIVDLLFKDYFFRTTRAAFALWRQVFEAIGSDKNVFEAIMTRASASRTFKVTAAAQAQDAINRGRSLKRVAFFMMAAALRVADLRSRLPALRTFLSDSFKQFHRTEGHDALRYCFMLFRVLLIKVPHAQRVKMQIFWSMVIPEAVQFLQQCIPKRHKLVQSDHTVVIEILKLVDFCILLAPNEFQPYRYLFVDDNNGTTSKGYTPLLLALRGPLPRENGEPVRYRLKELRTIVKTPASDARGAAPNSLALTTTEGEDVTPLRPLYALPDVNIDCVTTRIDKLAGALCAFSGLDDAELRFALDEDDEQDCTVAGMIRRDDLVDASYVDWVLASDFITGSAAGRSVDPETASGASGFKPRSAASTDPTSAAAGGGPTTQTRSSQQLPTPGPGHGSPGGQKSSAAPVPSQALAAPEVDIYSSSGGASPAPAPGRVSASVAPDVCMEVSDDEN